MIADIRQYFDLAVKLVDPDIKFQDDPFGLDDISDNIADSFYKLYFGATSMSVNGNFYREEMPATLEVYAGRKRDKTLSFDTVYSKALRIKNEVICPIRVKNSDYFTDIFAISATPEPLPNNENTIKIIIEFLIQRDITF